MSKKHHSCVKRFTSFMYRYICRKICGLGCVTRALERVRFTQPSPRIFLFFCSTELGKKACTWFGEICSCSSLPVLPGPAGDLLSRICIPYFRALYSPSNSKRPPRPRKVSETVHFCRICRVFASFLISRYEIVRVPQSTSNTGS